MKWFMEFDDAMRAVKASTGATGKQFEALTDKARALGRSTSYTATDVANAMLELGRIWGNPEQVDAAIAGMLDLARATGTDLPLATEIAAATLSQFGLEASEMARVADVLVAAANASAASLESIGDTMGYVGPIAKDVGMSLEETAKAVGVLANMGIKGSMAGTSLRQVLLRLARTKVQDTLRDKGVEVLDPKGNMRTDFGTVMTEIGKAIANMPNAERINLMRELFDQRAVSASLKLTTERFEGLSTAIDNCTGLARKQAMEMDAGIGGAWREMTGAIEDVAIAVGGTLAPTLRTVALYLTECANGISTFVEQNAGLIVGVTAVSAGLLILGPVISGIGSMVLAAAAGCGALATAFSAIVTVAGLMTTPLGAVAAGVLAIISLGGGIDALRTHFATFGATVDEVFGAVTNAIASGDMQLALQALVAGIRLELLRLQDMWLSFWEGLPFTGGDDKAFIKRINDIAKAENDLTRIAQQAGQRKQQAQIDRELAQDLDAALGLVPAQQQSAGVGNVAPSYDYKMGGGVAIPADELGGGGVRTLLFDIAPEAGLVSQITRSARGTFSSLAAGRMGAVGSATNPSQRQLEKLVQKQDHANKRLDQFVDLASKARLVFTGALPG
jgi:TP901 family phage tail tape measure protein